MNWIERFPALIDLEASTTDILMAASSITVIPEHSVIFGPGKQPDHLILLLEGSVRVQQHSEAGREIVLYRIRAGESCILTTACLLANEHYSAQGIAEDNVQAVLIPRRIFDQLLADSDVFRQFIFTTYSKRITELFHVMEELAFQRVDVRLAQKLLELAQGNAKIETTHQQLSVELGTAREVISRQLREFHRRGWIIQSRGSITLADRQHLSELASS